MMYFTKPMIYYKERLTPAEVLSIGQYKRYDFFIVNMGTHPTAYVRIPKTHPFYEKHYDEANPAPKGFLGGIFTFAEHSAHFDGHLDSLIPRGWYLGWDYAHIGDYIGNPFRPFNPETERKYTTEEMIEDCKTVINYLLEKKDVARERD